MRKSIAFLLFCALVSLFTACSQASTSSDITPPVEEETHAEYVSFARYDTLDDFLSFASNPVDGEDIADLASLEDISIPTDLPEGYELYKIVAGNNDIAFFYLPEEYLNDPEDTNLAEAQQKNFMFVDSRGSYDFDKVLNQLGGDRSQLIDNKYFVGFTSTNVIVWEEDGNVLWLHLPAEMTISDSETATMNSDAAVMSISESDFDAYCETECISIR